MKPEILKYYRNCLLASFLFCVGCISEYVPKDIDVVRGLVVVECTIQNGTTTVKLSRSIGLLDEFTGSEYIPEATVWVESSDGGRTEDGVYLQEGIYEIEVGELDLNKQYRLGMLIDGKLYGSEFLTPLQTPEIDEVFYEKEDTGHPVKLCVSTHDPLEQSHFYRWSFKEDWEVHADFYATGSMEWIGEHEVWVDYTEEDNIYACWGRDSSKVLHLGSSASLAEYRIVKKELLTIPPSDRRLSYLYHLRVEQTLLRKEAYDYFYNIQKNIEAGGGLFAPMPSELRGNVKNLYQPEEVVLGYVEVATMTTKGKYISGTEGLYEPPPEYFVKA
ncbi:MAG: DUF4249 domain-containing protein [Tannerellaceae bacterium]|nr:DUF4249 domain-containing protein [Tannerellaceae bacterium]